MLGTVKDTEKAVEGEIEMSLPSWHLCSVGKGKIGSWFRMKPKRMEVNVWNHGGEDVGGVSFVRLSSRELLGTLGALVMNGSTFWWS